MEGIKVDEVSRIIAEQLQETQTEAWSQVGTVLEVGDGIARIYGLSEARSLELVEFASGVKGMVLNLEYDTVGVAVLGLDKDIKEGEEVRGSGEIVKIPVGENFLGRVVNPLGEPLDGKGSIQAQEERPVEFPASGIIDRQPVKEPLQTGIKAIDALVPIGRGQRELIIGDRQTGKTTIAIDTILNQKDTGVICIYVAIGQKAANIARLVQIFEKHGVLEQCIIVAVSASTPAPLWYLAPYSGCALGEYFMYKGENVLCVYDDLTRHAQAYRQISLLLRRPPGREAFPGDIFYLHSRLLERAAKLNDELGGGSLTALPIVETQAGDVSAYIPTNIISITDGQIYLESDLFYSGIRPAINVGLSVSRVGGKAQTKAMKKVAGHLRLHLSQYREVAAFARLGGEVEAGTKQLLQRGERITELLKQKPYKPIPVENQVIQLWAANKGLLDELPTNLVNEFSNELVDYIKQNQSDILSKLKETTDLAEELEKNIEKAVNNFFETFILKHPEIKKEKEKDKNSELEQTKATPAAENNQPQKIKDQEKPVPEAKT